MTLTPDPKSAAATRTTGTPTRYADSPDSADHWTSEGPWAVAEGVYRIPLPLPDEALKAVNVYLIETPDGPTLIDGGDAVEPAREVLERCLARVGYHPRDVRRYLVTHAHRDHLTLANVLAQEYGTEVALGLADRPVIAILHEGLETTHLSLVRMIREAGGHQLAGDWMRTQVEPLDMAHYRFPSRWLDGDQALDIGGRTLDAVHTPGHTPGHFVFADQRAGLLFAGDHVLPTITPSIGFTMPPAPDPLTDFMASLARVRGLPDLRLLPAHGPIMPSTHARVDELLEHHERRLAQSLTVLTAGPGTAFDVANELAWTRHEDGFQTLDLLNQTLATLETKAHLEVLVARGQATREVTEGGTLFAQAGLDDLGRGPQQAPLGQGSDR